MLKKIIITILLLIGIYKLIINYAPIPATSTDKMNDLIMIQEK